MPRYNHAARLVADARYRRTALEVLGADTGHLLASDSAWSAVVRTLQDADALGWRAGQLLAEVVDLRELATARSMAEVIAWRIDAFISDRPAPPRLDEPAEADALRYASLLRALPAFNGATLDPAAAVQPPHPWPPGSGRMRRSLQQTAKSAPIADVVTGVLGATLAERARSEAAWPALEAALRRAQHRGHDPAALLERVARSRELRTARSVSEVLSWRIGCYLATEQSVAVAEDRRSGVPKLDARTWAMLAWALKAAENSGRDVAEAVASAAHAPDPPSALLGLTQAVGVHKQAKALPPWISAPVASSADSSDTDSQIIDYLNAADDEIRKRVAQPWPNASAFCGSGLALRRTITPSPGRCTHLSSLPPSPNAGSSATRACRENRWPVPQPGPSWSTTNRLRPPSPGVARPGPRGPPGITRGIVRCGSQGSGDCNAFVASRPATPRGGRADGTGKRPSASAATTSGGPEARSGAGAITKADR